MTSYAGNAKGADWEVCYAVNPAIVTSNAGLYVTNVRFKGELVLYSGSQPFSIVDYSAGGKLLVLKEGLSPQKYGFFGLPGAGANIQPQAQPYVPIPWNSPNSGGASPAKEGDTIVHVDVHQKSAAAPTQLVVAAKFQVGNYQYIHKWEFGADGTIEAGIGLGGPLQGWDLEQQAPGLVPELLTPTIHVHNFYFRLHFGLSADRVVEEFALRIGPNDKKTFGNEPKWWQLTHETKRTYSPVRRTRWRIREKKTNNCKPSPVANNVVVPKPHYKSWEIVPEAWTPPYLNYNKDAPFDKIKAVPSTADFWVVRNPAANGEGFGAEVAIATSKLPKTGIQPNVPNIANDHFLLRGYGSASGQNDPQLNKDGFDSKGNLDVFIQGKGKDITKENVVLWYVLREYHLPRWCGEEKTVLPYHFHHFLIKPRDVFDETPGTFTHKGVKQVNLYDVKLP